MAEHEENERLFVGILAGVLVVAVALFVLFLLMSLQPPSPAPAETGQIPEQERTAAKSIPKSTLSASEPNRAAVEHDEAKPDNGPHGDRLDPKRAESSAESWNRFNSTAITLFTFVLMVVAGLQFWAMWKQAAYMREGLEITREAADAARRSADVAERSLHLTERAFVIVGEGSLVNFGAGKCPTATLSLTNSGRTPAAFTDSVTVWLIDKELPETPPYSCDLTYDPFVVVMSAGEQWMHTTDCREITPDEHTKIISKELRMVVFGYFDYTDAFGNPHRTGWCREYAPHVTRDARNPFIFPKAPGYNYAT